MKKIFYFIASAIVALGAVACQNDIEENIENNQQTEGLSFTATIDDITRVVVDKSDIAEYDKKLSWEGNETIVVSDSDFKYSFNFKNTEATPNIFTCKEEGVNVLVGKTVSLRHGDDSSATFYDAHAEGSANSMYLTSDKNIENFATEQMGEIKMCVGQQLFRLECYEEVTLKMYTESGSIFFYDWKNGDDPKEEVVFAKGEHYFTANAAYDVTIEAYINGVKVKETSDKDFYNTSVIYNLGTIEAPAAPAEKVYLVLNNEWKEYDAWFAAYFWNVTTDANKSIVMTDADVDGIYECEVPADMDKVIFCRMNPKYTEFAWDVIVDEEVVEDRVWNQTADLEISVAPDNYYYIIGWESGLWGDENTDPTVSVAGQNSEWALIGAFNGWTDKYFITTETAGIVVLEKVTMKAAEGFLVRKPLTDWDDKYGAGDVNYLKANHFITTSKGGADMCLEADGTYDIYFDTTTTKIYIMTTGTDYNTATEQTVNGEEPKQEEPEVTEKVIYLKPNSNWTQSNARFAAYFWNDSGNVWVSMVDSDKDGIYEVNLPIGYDYGCSVIFCRMNPSTTANNWNNKWNQTSDLKVPTDGKNLYTVKDGTWDNGGGTWSVK